MAWAEQPPRAPDASARRSALYHVYFCWVVTLLAFARADCECGYSTSIGDDAQPYLFTDLIESDFVHLQNISTDSDWVRQAFNLTKEAARGDFGEMFTVDNVVANPIGDANTYTGLGDNGSNGGLQLVVRQHLVDDRVSGAEIDSRRVDLLWGSYRAAMKLTDTPGTCAAFFWYFNDTQEIDMEFLSKDFNPANNSYPVNLVLQSRASAEAGYNAQLTGNFVKAYLPFNPTTDFHEYRIDFVPGRVLFYADGQKLAEMNGTAVPTSPGHIVLQHWSNGNALWSGGPPLSDATLTVGYVKAYFNSSTSTRMQDWAGRCKTGAVPNSVCPIPERTSRNDTAASWFFSHQNNMTNNQTVYRENAGHMGAPPAWPVLALALLLGGYATEMW